MYWENNCDRLQSTRLLSLQPMFKLDDVAHQQKVNQIFLLKYRYLGLKASEYFPTRLNRTFFNLNTRPSNTQGEHRILIANSRHKLYFADSFGRENYKFPEQHYKQSMPQPLHSHLFVSGLHTINAKFHLFKIRRKKLPEFTMLTSFN